MSFRIETFEGKAGDHSGTVYVLTDGAARAEVWPFAGFNCLRWQVPTSNGIGDVLYTSPEWEANPVPTRSGHPVLFPFPNRIRDGKFTANGNIFELPLNDSTKSNAIHGFTPRNPWRVIDTKSGADEAAITGQFRLSVDLPESLPLWPSDCALTLTYRLSKNALRVDARVDNPGSEPMPWGLGYHPYFRIPTAPQATVDELVLRSGASTLWPLTESLPTGEEVPIPIELDFRSPRPIGSAVFDHLFGGLERSSADADGFATVAEIRHPNSPGRLMIEAEPAFGKLVLFTPVHRQAIAIEPYSCISDAANLQAAHPTAGWAELQPGQTITISVRYRWNPEPTS